MTSYVPKKKYIAKLDGEVIGTRQSDRTYTHAIVCQRIEAVYSHDAYHRVASPIDRVNFDDNMRIAVCDGITVDHTGMHVLSPSDGASKPVAGEILKANDRYVHQYSRDEIDAAKAKVEGGYDAYVARLRERAIERFETMRRDGSFKPYVAGWAGRRDLAGKAAPGHTGRTVRLVAIVPVHTA